MNFISRYKTNSNRPSSSPQDENKIQSTTTVSNDNLCNLNNENSADSNCQNLHKIKSIELTPSIFSSPETGNIILYQSDNKKFEKMKEKKRQSKSASSLLRRLLTCGGVVTHCSGTNSNNKSASNSRRSSKSGHLDLRIPDIILTHPESDENLTINSFKELKNISVSDPSLTLKKSDDDFDEQVVPQDDKKMILPIIKLNDDYINCEDEEEEIEEEEEEIIDEENYEYSEDEDEEVDEEEEDKIIDDENSFQNNITSIIIEEAEENYLDDTQVFEELDNSKENKTMANLSSTTIPSFSFEVHSDDPDKSDSFNKTEEANETENEIKSKNTSPNKLHNQNHHSKFLTANNILTERGGLVNIRTGSFNLGCQQSAASSSSLSQDKYLNDDELIDSNEFFNSLQHENHEFRNSVSNYSFKNSASYSLDDNSAFNLLVPFLLIKNRRKSSNLTDANKLLINSNDYLCDEGKNLTSNSSTDYSLKNSSIILNQKNCSSLKSNSLSINTSSLLSPLVTPSGEQDQVRRCSHDPNIEKLHKSYIENVKLASAQIFSSNTNITNKNESNNDSQTSLTQKYRKKSLKFSDNFTSLDGGGGGGNDTSNLNDLNENKDDKIELESEKSDVLNEIFKVDNWLRDNRNTYHQNKKEYSKRLNNSSRLPSVAISEDEDNFCTKNLDPCNNLSNKNSICFYEDENDDNDVNSNNDAKAKYSSETTDSAIDVRSYGSISTLSKASSSKSRVNWQSFSKYYHYYFFQSMNTTWSKYQIAAMSLEQLMALRKLALIQFSKLVERQHSTMIRTLRLFSKKNAANEFQRVYDSYDSTNPSKSHVKTKLNPSTTSPNFLGSNASLSVKESSILIGNRKVSNHLGAKLGHHLSNELIPTTNIKKKRHRNSVKKLEKELSINNESCLIINDEVSVSSNPGEYFDSLPTEYPDQPIQKEKKEVVFGLPLSTIMQLSGQPLPQPILESMRFIRKIAPTEIGVFRKNGNKNRINRLKEIIDNNEPINFQSSEINVFDVADTLKLYFRELPECLITNKLSDILLSNYSRIRPEERKTTLQQVMLLIPDENRLVLQTLLLFLNDISKHHKVNQMTKSNLAVIFSPVIFSMNFDNKKKPKNLKYISTMPVNMNLAKTISLSNNEDTDETINEIQEQNETVINQQVVESTEEKLENSDKNEIQGDNESPETVSNQLDVKQLDYKRNSTTAIDSKTSQLTISQQQSRLLSVPNAHLGVLSMSSTNSHPSSNQTQTSNTDLNSNLIQMIKQNSKRKYSDRLNKAASTLANFGVEFGSSKGTSLFSDSTKDSLETLDFMNKVVQLCVSDMIKYSMDLFTVPVENFEKLKLSVSYGSEPYNLDYFYDLEKKIMKRIEFFTNNVKIEKINWFYFDKFEDVSIYYFKNDFFSQSLLKNISSNTNSSHQTHSTINNSHNQTTSNNTTTISSPVSIQITCSEISMPEAYESVQSSFLIHQKNESFNDKLKLWKCCTLVKHQNLTLEKILTRIKDERFLWDDDFRDGKLVEKLDDVTELYRYVIAFMPPHPSRDFFEIRHSSYHEGENETLILTSTSVKHQAGNKLIGDIRSNLIISKYVIEKLISTDTTTTFKITHYIKMDYKGFTLEFYNKTFGYMMARLLYNLKMSLLNTKING
ncbi:unnamed protein product [Brachionus calyciflorus]|uniref:Uncharacterized protein n=1 Tax=Brachionus calyciflorus TaxID=104777 RepID=A0A814AL84_9BILA|nr:unnamed protein product [Brachionus calyciflorus]